MHRCRNKSPVSVLEVTVVQERIFAWAYSWQQRVWAWQLFCMPLLDVISSKLRLHDRSDSRLRQIELLTQHGFTPLTVAAFIAYVGLFGGELNIKLSFLAGGGYVCFLLLHFSAVRERKLRRDSRAQSIVHEPQISKNPYALYLRPFFVDTHGLMRSPGFFNITPMTFSVKVDEAIARAVEPEWTLVKLGSPGVAAFGAGTLEYGTSISVLTSAWFQDLLRLTPDAEVVIAVPLVFQGAATLAEIKMLSTRGWDRKLVFLMPSTPKYVWDDDGVVRTESTTRLWEQSRELLSAELGIRLPAYEQGGGLLVPTNGGWRLVRFAVGEPWLGETALRTVLLNTSLRGRPSADAFRVVLSSYGAAGAFATLYFVTAAALLTGHPEFEVLFNYCLLGALVLWCGRSAVLIRRHNMSRFGRFLLFCGWIASMGVTLVAWLAGRSLFRQFDSQIIEPLGFAFFAAGLTWFVAWMVFRRAGASSWAESSAN